MSVQSFKYLCNPETQVLVLGTMPGIASLDAIEYYAHKRNAFWPIMLAITGLHPVSYAPSRAMSYAARVSVLLEHGIGLWDVLAQCERAGSLDSAIETDSIVVNDFARLLTQYPGIKSIVFNGKAAQKLFQRYAMPALVEHGFNTDAINFHALPSTSPTMASLSLEQKYSAWNATFARLILSSKSNST